MTEEKTAKKQKTAEVSLFYALRDILLDMIACPTIVLLSAKNTLVLQEYCYNLNVENIKKNINPIIFDQKMMRMPGSLDSWIQRYSVKDCTKLIYDIERHFYGSKFWQELYGVDVRKPPVFLTKTHPLYAKMLLLNKNVNATNEELSEIWAKNRDILMEGKKKLKEASGLVQFLVYFTSSKPNIEILGYLSHLFVDIYGLHGLSIMLMFCFLLDGEPGSEHRLHALSLAYTHGMSDIDILGKDSIPVSLGMVLPDGNCEYSRFKY